MKRNTTGQVIDFCLVDLAGNEITTGTAAILFRGDNGDWATSPQAAAYETAAWRWRPNQAETNHVHVALKPLPSVAALPQVLNIYTDGTEARVVELEAAADLHTAALADLSARLPEALEGGRISAHTAALADGVITSAKFTVAAIDGPATGILEQLRQLWRRFFAAASITAEELVTYADDGETAITTQAVADDGTTQTQGAAE